MLHSATTDSAEGQAGQFQAGDPLPTSLESFGARIQATELGMFRSRVSNGNVLDCNERIAEILGYESREDCLERYRFDLHYGSTASRMQVIELLADEASHAFESEARRVDGDTVWLEVRAQADMAADVIECASVDITERKRAQLALQASEDNLRRLSEMTSDCCWVTSRKLDGTEKREWIAGSFERLTGYTHEEFSDIGREGLVHPDDFARAMEIVAHQWEVSGIVETEIRIITKAGQTRWLRERTRTVNCDDVLRMYGATRDVTESKESERALKGSSRMYRLLAEEQLFILDHMADFVYRHDRKGVFYYFSPAAERITGYPIDELYGHYSDLLTDAPSTQDAIRFTEHALRTGEEMPPYPVEIWHRDGTRRTLEINEQPFFEGGEVAGIIGVARDITARIEAENARGRAEQQLAQYREHLEELIDERTRELDESREQLREQKRLASLGTLAAGIAHEINNPLGAILMSTEAILRRIDDPASAARVRQYLESIKAECKRGGRIVRGVLQFSREEVGALEMGDYAAVVGAACRHNGRLAEDRDVAIEVEGPEQELPLPAFAISVTGLEQALGNLIANAVQASCSGDVVRVCFDGDESEVRTRVIDRGHGMVADHAARVFDPFFTTRQIEGGSGLGLSIAHGIIEQHRGTISVNSTVGEGTTMCVVLPIAPE